MEEHIAIINHDGNIIYVNKPWRDFGTLNNIGENINWLEHNYLDVCQRSAASGDSLAKKAYHGLQHLLHLETDLFQLEYPCHSPEEERWFELRAVRLGEATPNNSIIISHRNITELKEAETLSLHDPLTMLANRRHLKDFLLNEIRRCYRHNASLGILMLDIDLFKQYNDTFGHLAGDRCLCTIANIIKSFTRRPGDLAARYGGDEFIVVMDSTSGQECNNLAHAIRNTVANLNLSINDEKSITVSIGIVAGIPHKDLTIHCILDKADACLYQSKNRGGNQVFGDTF